MESKLKKQLVTFANFDKKAQELEERLKKIRIEVHNLFWELVKLRKEKR